MAITGRRFSASTAQIGAVAETLYTATNVKAQVQGFTLTNTTGGAITATVYLVPTGQTAGAANTVLSARSIGAGESYRVIEAIGQWLNAGDTIQALASSAASISAYVSGIEVT